MRDKVAVNVADPFSESWVLFSLLLSLSGLGNISFKIPAMTCAAPLGAHTQLIRMTVLKMLLTARRQIREGGKVALSQSCRDCEPSVCSIREGGGIGNDRKLSRSLGPNLPRSRGRCHAHSAKGGFVPVFLAEFLVSATSQRLSSRGQRKGHLLPCWCRVFFSSSLPRGCVSHVA